MVWSHFLSEPESLNSEIDTTGKFWGYSQKLTPVPMDSHSLVTAYPTEVNYFGYALKECEQLPIAQRGDHSRFWGCLVGLQKQETNKPITATPIVLILSFLQIRCRQGACMLVLSISSVLGHLAVCQPCFFDYVFFTMFVSPVVRPFSFKTK